MKLTGWYRGDQKPVRKGVYQRSYWCGIVYCYWNGKYFGRGYSAKKYATKEDDSPSHAQNLLWRGVSK